MDFSFTPIDFAPTILRAIVGHRDRNCPPALGAVPAPFADDRAVRQGRGRFLGQMHNVDEFVSLPAQFVGHHGGCVAFVETTETRTPFRCTASTNERKSPSPEKRTR